MGTRHSMPKRGLSAASQTDADGAASGGVAGPGSGDVQDGFFTLTITLRSDLCCGTGESNGVAVDQVTSLDGLGLPVIPAKRLKGLLRQEASLVAAPAVIDSLFGSSGSELPGRLTFSDAQLVGHEAIERHIMDEGIAPAEVAAVYTMTRSQTSVDYDGVAKDHSLRTTQVVRRCDEEGIPTTFVCHVRGERLSQAERSAFVDVAACLRSIGMNRSRGLGEVSCGAEWSAEGRRDVIAVDSEDVTSCLGYRIVLERPVVLNGGPDGPLDYLPGSVLQGVFARLFAQSDPDFFAAHVLTGSRFSNAYVDIEGNGGRRSEPVSLALKTAKNAMGTLPLFDLSAEGTGELPSVQRVSLGGYGVEEGDGLVVANVRTSLSTHSSARSSAQGQQLYTLRSIDAGQSFSGTITGTAEALGRFCEAISRRGGRMAVGGARSSGYGACTLSLHEVNERPCIELRPGDRVRIRLVSDVVYVDRKGTNSVDVPSFVRDLSAEGGLGFTFDAASCLTFTRASVAGGYNAHWRLPKRQLRTIAKGSTLVATVVASKGRVPAVVWFGGLQNEGFGELRIERVTEEVLRTYVEGQPAVVRQEETVAQLADEPGRVAFLGFQRGLAYHRLMEEAEERAYQLADRQFPSSPLASKSSSMRIGALLSSARKECVRGDAYGGSLWKTLSAMAYGCFGKDSPLATVCQGLVSEYEGLGPGRVDSERLRNRAFASFVQAYLHQLKSLYALAGRD